MSDTIHSQFDGNYSNTNNVGIDPTTYKTRKLLEKVADMLDEKNKAYT